MNKQINSNVLFLLKDDRLCKSPNMQSFFRSQRGKELAKHIGWFKETDGMRVIRFEGDIWFATLGWMTNSGKENGFSGVRVKQVACFGSKATTGYPSWQKGGDYEDVTDWFWSKYKERGIVAFPEVWHREIPIQLTHAEVHTF